MAAADVELSVKVQFLNFDGQTATLIHRHVNVTSSQLVSVHCSLFTLVRHSAQSHVWLLCLVVGISNCVQRHLDLQSLTTTFVNRKLTKRLETSLHLQISIEVSG